jgi:hypothetical protein
MLKQQLNQASLPGAKLPMNTASGQPMQESDGLLGEQSFKFVGGHVFLVKREAYRSTVSSFMFQVRGFWFRQNLIR